MAWAPPESDRLAVSRHSPVGGGWTPPQNDVMSVVAPKPAPRIPSWQEAIFPNRTAAGGDIAPLGLTALGASAKDLAALPVNLLSGAYEAIQQPTEKGAAFRRGMAGTNPGDMSQNERIVAGLSLAGGPVGKLAQAAIPAARAAAPLAQGLANFARAGYVGAAESLPAAVFQAGTGDGSGALANLALGGALGGGRQATGAAARGSNKVAGNLAESMTGIPESDLRKIGFLGNSEYGKRVLAVAGNRREHLNDLGASFLDRVRNFDQYLPNAAEVDKIVSELPPIDGTRIIAALEKAKPKLKATPESAASIAKIDNLTSIAAEFLDKDGKIPANIARQVRQEYDAVIGDAFGKESASYVNALKNGRHEIAKALEDAATESGKPEYAQAMRDYSTRLGALDDVLRKLGGDKKTQEDRIEAYLSNLFQGNKTKQQEAFAKLSDLMGEDFAAQARILSDAKRIAPTGTIPLLSAHKTGKAGLGGGLMGVGYGIGSGNPAIVGASLLSAGLGSPALAPGLLGVTDRVARVAGSRNAGRLARAAEIPTRAYLQSQIAGE